MNKIIIGVTFFTVPVQLSVFDGFFCRFSNIGIQCCKRHDITESLRTRAKIRVDPYASR